MENYGSSKSGENHVEASGKTDSDSADDLILQTPQESSWWLLLGSLRMEPGFLLYMIASVMGNIIASDMQLDRACRVNKGYNDSICDILMGR